MVFLINFIPSMISFRLFIMITMLSSCSLSEILTLHDSYKCYVFCLASCYNETKDFRFCEMNCHLNTYPTDTCLGNSNKDIQKGHELQIPEWNDTVISYTNISSSNDYASIIHPPENPRLIELEWHIVDKALIYVLMWREFMANDTPPQFQLYETQSNRLTFIKQLMCAEHEFRVAAINDKQFGNFSEILHIIKPLPALDNFNLRVSNLELVLNKATLQYDTSDWSSNFDVVNVTLTYDWPLNWNESIGDIEQVEMQSVVAQSPRDCRCALYKAKSPKRMDSENATTSVDYLISTNLTGCTCNIWFKINSIVSRCGDKLKVGVGSNNVDFAEIHCNSVQNAKFNSEMMHSDQTSSSRSRSHMPPPTSVSTVSASRSTMKLSSTISASASSTMSVSSTRMSGSSATMLASSSPSSRSTVSAPSVSMSTSKVAATTTKSETEVKLTNSTVQIEESTTTSAKTATVNLTASAASSTPLQCQVEEFSSWYDNLDNNFHVSWLVINENNSGFVLQPINDDKRTYIYRITSFNLNSNQTETIMEPTEISINLTKEYVAEAIIPIDGMLSNESLYYMQICPLPANNKVPLIDWSMVIEYIIYYPIVDSVGDMSEDFKHFVAETATTLEVLKKAQSPLPIDSTYLMIYIGIGIFSCVLLNFCLIFYVRMRRRRRNIAKPLRNKNNAKGMKQVADEIMISNQSGKFTDDKNEYILNTFSKL